MHNSNFQKKKQLNSYSTSMHTKQKMKTRKNIDAIYINYIELKRRLEYAAETRNVG